MEYHPKDYFDDEFQERIDKMLKDALQECQYENLTTVHFNKSDFDGFEDLENGVKRSSTLTKVAIFFIVLLLIGTIFLILNFVLGWNIL